jgi:MarR family transcriptional regulator, 2-MHQ and catechol-resistance regulon repressor
MSTAAVTDRELSLKLWVVLARAYRALAHQSRRDIEQHGLVASEFAALEVLYHKGDLPVGDVSERVLLTSGSMTHIVDKLERRGLVARRRCPEDQRVTYLTITPSGRALMASIFPTHAEAIRRAAAGLGPDEKRALISLLKRLGLAAAQALKELSPQRSGSATESPAGTPGRTRN